MMSATPKHQANLKKNSYQVGKWCENMAVTYLREKHYHILEKNFRAAQYEIDLITLAPEGILVFVEVKYRKSNSDFSIETAFSQKQQEYIQMAAEKFLSLHEVLRKRHAQFDVIFITGPTLNASSPPQAKDYLVQHITQAFSYK